MMFIFHTAITLALIALSLGIILFIWGIRHEGSGVSLAKGIGIIVATFAILSMICSGYYVLKYWHEGYFETPTGMSMMQSKTMMKGTDGMMMHNPMQNNKNNPSNQ